MQNFIPTFMLVSIFIYLMFHVVSGERGLIALVSLSKKVQTAQNKLDEVNSQKLKLSHKISLLRDNSIDIDLLDEQSRKILSRSSKGEIIFLRVN